jgi:hypothetical protein
MCFVYKFTESEKMSKKLMYMYTVGIQHFIPKKKYVV